MRSTYIVFLAFCLFLGSIAFAVSGPFNYDGRTYYVVSASDPNANTGTAVCASVGLQCVGYTDWDSVVCQMAHPNADMLYGDQGSKAGFYCNGPPAQGICSSKYNSCEICDQCNVNADCNTTIGQFMQEMYVQCAPNASDWVNQPPPGFHPGVTTVSTSLSSPFGFLTPVFSFFGGIFGSFSSFITGLFGGGAPSQPAATGGSLCPLGCYLTTTDVGDINCNVDQNSVHKALPSCPGKQTDLGQGPLACQCLPVETVSQACPGSCTTTQPGCNVNPDVIGKSYVPCDGTVPGSSMNCKCIYRNGGWAVGAQYGVH
jgi:hypothetical protein